MNTIAKSHQNTRSKRNTYNMTYRNKAINRLRKLYANTGDPLTLESIKILMQDNIDAKERNKLRKKKRPTKKQQKEDINSEEYKLRKLGSFAYHASKKDLKTE